MRKRLLIGLLSAGLVGAMLPGVASAEARWDGWFVSYHCENNQRYAPPTSMPDLWIEGWPPTAWRSEVDWGRVDEAIDYLATEYSLDCRTGGLGFWYYAG